MQSKNIHPAIHKFPGIVEMQTAAIVGAAAPVKKEGIDVNPEIMIPLIGHVNELKAVRGDLKRIAKETEAAEVSKSPISSAP